MTKYDPVRAKRVPTQIVATVTAGKRTGVKFTILNVSITGAKLEGPLALNKGEQIKIRFQSEGKSIEVVAEVVRVDTEDLLSDQIAARFLDLTPDAHAAIQEIVDEHLAELDNDATLDRRDESEEPETEIVLEPED